MTWVRIEEGFPEHPKVLAAGGDAAWLFVAGLCYCNRNLTDGFIPSAVLGRLMPGKRTQAFAATLVGVNLWETTDGGWMVHDFDLYQPSRADAEATRDKQHSARAEAGRLGGIASGVARRNQQRSESEANTNQNKSKHEARSVPIRPDPFSSSSVGSSNVRPIRDDDDQVLFTKTIDIMLEIKARKHPPRDRDAWEPITRGDLIAKKGDHVRAELAAGHSPTEAAGSILGSQVEAELAAQRLA